MAVYDPDKFAKILELTPNVRILASKILEEKQTIQNLLSKLRSLGLIWMTKDMVTSSDQEDQNYIQGLKTLLAMAEAQKENIPGWDIPPNLSFRIVVGSGGQYGVDGRTGHIVLPYDGTSEQFGKFIKRALRVEDKVE